MRVSFYSPMCQDLNVSIRESRPGLRWSGGERRRLSVHLDVFADPSHISSMARDTEATPRLHRQKLITFFRLDPSEMIASGVLALLLPLVSFGIGIPFPLNIVAAISWVAWAYLLFFVKRNDTSAITWLLRMVPFWLRQKRFRSVRESARITTMHDALIEATSIGANALSYRVTPGRDGVSELHVYEETLRPYRGWIAAGGRPTKRPQVSLPSIPSTTPGSE